MKLFLNNQMISYDINLKHKTFKILSDFINAPCMVAIVDNYDCEYANVYACVAAFRYVINARDLPIAVYQQNNKLFLEKICPELQLSSIDTHKSKWHSTFTDFLNSNKKSALIPNTNSYKSIKNAQSIAARQAKHYNLPIKIKRKNNQLFMRRIDIT